MLSLILLLHKYLLFTYVIGLGITCNCGNLKAQKMASILLPLRNVYKLRASQGRVADAQNNREQRVYSSLMRMLR